MANEMLSFWSLNIVIFRVALELLNELMILDNCICKEKDRMIIKINISILF